MNSPLISGGLSRRGLLFAAGGAAVAAVVGSQIATPAFAAPNIAQSWQRIGPQQISDPSQMWYLPKDANLVKWRWARNSGTTLNQAIATLGANDILVLPEDAQPYEVDSSKGFNGAGAWRAMLRVKRGIVGMGPNTVIRPSASAFRAGRQTVVEGTQEAILEATAAGAYFGNFTMLGRDFGGIAHHAIKAFGNDTIFQGIRFLGAHRGFNGKPPGETGAISGSDGARMQIRNVEVDGRDPDTGQYVGTSPIMFNRAKDTIVTDFWAHNTAVGMPTWWKCTNAWVERFYHEDVKLGAFAGNSPGVNIEEGSGTFTFIDSTFKPAWRGPTGNSGLHLNVGGGAGFQGRINVKNATIDTGPAGPGVLSIQHWGAQRQSMVTYVVTNAAGAAAPYKVFGL